MAPGPRAPRDGGGGRLTGARPSAASRVAAVFLALLVPGLGHVWAGRRARGAAFFGLVLAAFGAGLFLGGTLGSFEAPGAGASLTAAAAHAVVVPSLLARAAGLGSGDPASPSFEVATTCLVVAGLMNVLLAFDAWDAAGEKRP